MKSSGNKKREREQDESTTVAGDFATPSGHGTSTTNFRNVSACNRCRNRKNKCDQKLPRCTGCEKANIQCTGFDPISRREVPRSYIFYLETRVNSLEDLLRSHNIPCPPPSEHFSISDDIKSGNNAPLKDEAVGPPPSRNLSTDESDALDPALHDNRDEHDQLNNLANNIGMVSVRGSSDSHHHSSKASIPFAKVVFAAVKRSIPQIPSDPETVGSSKQLPSATASGGGGGADSFFGLNTKPTIKPAPWPERHIGLALVELYFEHANPQIPILHRGEFLGLFERVYATAPKKRGPRELYLLQMVFAIGSGIIMDPSEADHADSASDTADIPPNRKRRRVGSQRGSVEPEEYHSAAIVHLDSFVASTPALHKGGLEELQAILLLAGLALLRPVAPGLWYIVGVAVRLAVDLGLHCEDPDVELDRPTDHTEPDGSDLTSTDTKQWSRDLRRRLWWCVYSFDRLVSTCVGRPFGITDEVITTDFPSLLDDKYITIAGFSQPPNSVKTPSYKLVAHHYFRLRQTQSEIGSVLQHRQAEQARVMSATRSNVYIHTLPSPFLQEFQSFREWRADIDRRLWHWKDTAPKQAETGVAFTPLFLELNYWQAIITLYRQSLAVPAALAGELSPSTSDEMHSPGIANFEREEEQELVFMKVGQAGQTVLKIYRGLHRLHLINYTFLATHHIFMSGISFLYAIWHSPMVRSQLTLDDVDFTILIATSVLTDLIRKCPPAEACRDAFMRTAKATISMCISTTGFGDASTLGSQSLNTRQGLFEADSGGRPMARTRTPMPQFDMNLKDLFSDEELASRPQAHQPRPQDFGLNVPTAPSTSYPPLPTRPSVKQESSFHSTSSLHPYHHPSSPSSHQVPHQQPYHPQMESLPQAGSNFSFEHLDFLNTLPSNDPNDVWTGANEFDFGFTGGTGYDSSGVWEANGGVDLFDGFFFGNSGS
ncbi:hypothetical protein LTR08_007614 [Meristemomyces frigidus]|nr:hypothetical protein LTR08_007614 [Meristemomyces frigidus]